MSLTEVFKIGTIGFQTCQSENGKVYPSPEQDPRIKANVWAFM